MKRTYTGAPMAAYVEIVPNKSAVFVFVFVAAVIMTFCGVFAATAALI